MSSFDGKSPTNKEKLDASLMELSELLLETKTQSPARMSLSISKALESVYYCIKFGEDVGYVLKPIGMPQVLRELTGTSGAKKVDIGPYNELVKKLLEAMKALDNYRGKDSFTYNPPSRISTVRSAATQLRTTPDQLRDQLQAILKPVLQDEKKFPPSPNSSSSSTRFSSS